MLREEQLGRLAQLGALVNGISRLVHMLQCERGASNVWLCSQGKLYAPECKASRAPVDENLAALHLQFNEPLPGSALCERIASALHGLETLTALRDGVTGQCVTAPQAMEHYSRILRHLLSIVPQLSDSIDDPHIAGRFVALYSLMQGKELVGQERALGAIGFTGDSLTMKPASGWWIALMASRPALRFYLPLHSRRAGVIYPQLPAGSGD